MNPSLLLVCSAAGASDPRCRESFAALVAHVSRALPDVVVRQTRVGASSELEDLMPRLTRPAVVLPLFAAATGSLLQEVTLCAALATTPVRVAGALGPHRLLARAMVARLRQAGACWGDAVVLAAPSSACDALALADTERAARLLRSEWSPLVSVASEDAAEQGFSASWPAGGGVAASGGGGAAPETRGLVTDLGHLGQAVTGIGQAVQDWHDVGSSRVFVVPYVISYAPAIATLRATAAAAGATGVTDPLAPHPLVADLVAQRYEQSARSLRAGAAHAA